MSLQIAEPVLILGGGINGIAVARELALNGIPSCIVEKFDLGYGATSKSSRLIHGGLRYLEYADFKLVRESLHERNQLVKVAPQFVKPLRLLIPVKSRFRGFGCAASRFLRLGRWWGLRSVAKWLERNIERGALVVGTGLTFYDWIAANKLFPKHRVQRIGEQGLPPFDPEVYRFACSYSDGQILSPERFILAMLEDTRKLLQETTCPLEVFTHHQVERVGDKIRVHNTQGEMVKEWVPPLVINASGSWGDLTLSELQVKSDRMFGGTKGSHFFSRHTGLREAVGENGVYAEAADGRPVFVLPLGDQVMVGTTDIHLEGLPEEAVASEQEVAYLLDLVNDLFPQLNMTKEAVEMHYCGVRPLPYQDQSSTSAISRGHAIRKSREAGTTVLTLVGGKLTTCRALGEEVAEKVATLLKLSITQTSQNRLFPGAEEYPGTVDIKASLFKSWREQFSLSEAQLEHLFPLYGTRLGLVLQESELDLGTITGTEIPKGFVRWVIQNEWCETLEDLVERRLLLLYQPGLSRESLVSLASQFVALGKLAETEVASEVERLVIRLRQMYGKIVN